MKADCEIQFIKILFNALDSVLNVKDVCKCGHCIMCDNVEICREALALYRKLQKEIEYCDRMLEASQ